jgi:hypothetical protein
MKEFNIDQKLQVCGYCSKLENIYFVLQGVFDEVKSYCTEKRMYIEEIKNCGGWDSFWNDGEEK